MQKLCWAGRGTPRSASQGEPVAFPLRTFLRCNGFSVIKPTTKKWPYFWSVGSFNDGFCMNLWKAFENVSLLPELRWEQLGVGRLRWSLRKSLGWSSQISRWPHSWKGHAYVYIYIKTHFVKLCQMYYIKGWKYEHWNFKKTNTFKEWQTIFRLYFVLNLMQDQQSSVTKLTVPWNVHTNNHN